MEERAPRAASPGEAERRTSRRLRPPSGRRARARRLPFRNIGRNIVIFASANAVISLLLPWMRSWSGSVNAFGLRRVLWAFPVPGWVPVAAWFVLGAAVLAAGVAVVDRYRSLGSFAAYVALATGGWLVLLSGHIFESVPLLRQVGVVACGVSGLIYLAGGALLFRAKWEKPPPRAEPVGAVLRRAPWVTVALVALMVASHAAVSALPRDARADVIRGLGLLPGSLRWYAPLTYMFLHADWLHLLANAAVLVAVGAALERRAGRVVFLATYLVSGVAGGLASFLVGPRIHVPLVGASGAVAGVMGLCLALAPGARVSVWFHAGVAAGRLRLQAAWLFSAWIVLQAVGSFYLALGEAGPVAYWAHLGGVVAGLAAGGVVKLTGLARPAPEGEAEAGAAPGAGTLAARHAGAGSAGLHARQGRPGPLSSLTFGRRAMARDRLAAGCLPHAVIAVSLLLSVAAVAVSFGSGSLMRQLVRFQRAWNSGDLERVDGLFDPRRRDELSGRLREFVRKLDPGSPPAGGSPEGRTGYGVALSGTSRSEERCVARFRLAPPGTDPFRARTGRFLRVELRREGGRWSVVAMGTPAVSSQEECPASPEEEDPPPPASPGE